MNQEKQYYQTLTLKCDGYKGTLPQNSKLLTNGKILDSIELVPDGNVASQIEFGTVDVVIDNNSIFSENYPSRQFYTQTTEGAEERGKKMPYEIAANNQTIQINFVNELSGTSPISGTMRVVLTYKDKVTHTEKENKEHEKSNHQIHHH